MESFSDRLKQLMSQRSVTQAQLVLALGISKRALIYYVSGERTPPLKQLVDLADYFSVSLDYLVGRSDDPTRY